jgi:hypothetical protein
MVVDLELCQRASVSWTGFVATRGRPVYQDHAVAPARDYTELRDQQGMSSHHRYRQNMAQRKTRKHSNEHVDERQMGH